MKSKRGPGRPKRIGKHEAFHIFLPVRISRPIRALAAQEQRPLNGQIAHMLEEWLKEREAAE